MTVEEKNFYKEMKRTFRQVAVSLSVIIIIALVGFYYNTQNAIKYQDAQIREIKNKIDILIQLHLKN